MEEKRSTLKSKVLNKSMIPYVAISIFAIVFFISIYGVKVLDFQNVDWLYGHYEVKENCFYGKDLTQHYMGWLCYRQSDWTFPIGNMNLFSYPYQTSVIYTDSIPLFALFFKILSPILPEKFQYFGLWAILCFILQGIMAVRLFKSHTKNPVNLVLAAAFFVIVPMLLWRTFIHSALCAHWIILMAMEPLVDKVRWDKKHLMIHYSLVGFLASMTAIYLLLFCGIVLIGTCVRDVLETKKVLNSVLSLISFVGVAALAIAIMGGFSGEFASSLGGLGEYSMNLNSFFDSYGLSSFGGELSRYTAYGDRQFEGYGYLGVGTILLILISLCIVMKEFKVYKIALYDRKSVAIGVGLVLVISLMYAMSPVITLGSWKMVEIPLPGFVENMWSIFRATGRGVWVLVYLILFFGCLFIVRLENKKVAMCMFFICLCLQFVDNFPMYRDINSYFNDIITPRYNYEALTSCPDFWERIAGNDEIKNIILANTTTPYDDEKVSRIGDVYDSFVGPDDGLFKMYQYLLGDFSIKNNKTFNYYRFSRHPYERSRQYVLNKLKNPTEEDLFVFYEYNKFQGVAAGLNMYGVDGLYVGYVGDLGADYRLSDEYLQQAYLFEGSSELEFDGAYYSLDANEQLKCFTLEMPEGVYMISIYGENLEDLTYGLSTASNECADIIYSEGNSNEMYYLVTIQDDTYRAYNFFDNEGISSVGLYAITVEYLGSEEVL